MVLELLPTDVARMVAANQDTPFCSRLVVPMALPGAPAHDRGALRRPAEDISPSVYRMPQNIQYGVVGGSLPFDLRAQLALTHDR